MCCLCDDLSLRMEWDEAVSQMQSAAMEKDVAVKDAVKVAVKEARAEEREHYAKVIDKEKQEKLTLKGIIDKQKMLVTNLLNRSVFAEREAKRANRDAQQSIRRSYDV